MKIFAIGDIHGGYKAVRELIEEKICPTAQDQLIFLGDYVDGWSESLQVIEYLMELDKHYQCLFILGNHDQLFLDWLDRDISNPLWEKHGGLSTINAYKNISPETKQKHIDFLSQLKPYFIDEHHRLFVHAGFTNLRGIEQEQYKVMCSWDRTLWELALCMDKNMSHNHPYYPSRLKHYKEIFIGHTPTTRYDKTTVMNAMNIWNIDTGAAYHGPLTAIEVNSKKTYATQPVHLLYPNEKKRS